MALQRSCDSPACEVTLDVGPEELEELPAGWWLLERSEEATYTLCSLECVSTLAELFATPTIDGPEEDEGA